MNHASNMYNSEYYPDLPIAISNVDTPSQPNKTTFDGGDSPVPDEYDSSRSMRLSLPDHCLIGPNLRKPDSP